MMFIEEENSKYFLNGMLMWTVYILFTYLNLIMVYGLIENNYYQFHETLFMRCLLNLPLKSPRRNVLICVW